MTLASSNDVTDMHTALPALVFLACINGKSWHDSSSTVDTINMAKFASVNDFLPEMLAAAAAAGENILDADNQWQQLQ